MRQCQIQKTLNREAKIYSPPVQSKENLVDFVKVDYCYKKQKVLNQILRRSKIQAKKVTQKETTKTPAETMSPSPIHYVSSPDGNSSVSDNKVTKKMRKKHEKIHERADPWYYTSDEDNKNTTPTKIIVLARDVVMKETTPEPPVSDVEEEPPEHNTYCNDGNYYNILFND